MARITVINDYLDFLEMMHAILDGELDHDVVGFDDDEISLEDIVASDPELVIVDLRLGGREMKGWDILLMCRGDDRLRPIPIIVCSADVATMRERAEEFARMDVFTLEKPFDLDSVEQAVDRALGASTKGESSRDTERPAGDEVA
jgi:DNA-binding NtrC family response regulator